MVKNVILGKYKGVKGLKKCIIFLNFKFLMRKFWVDKGFFVFLVVIY